MIQLNGFKFYLARKAGNKARWACSTHHRFGCRAAILTVDDLITSLNQHHMHRKGKGMEDSKEKLEPIKKGRKKIKRGKDTDVFPRIVIAEASGTDETQIKVKDQTEEKLILESVDDELYGAGEMYKVLHLGPDGESYIIELQNPTEESQYSSN